MTNRHDCIVDKLGFIGQIAIKYDYFFEGKLIHNLQTNSSFIFNIEILPNKNLAIISNDSIEIWDSKTLKCLHILTTHKSMLSNCILSDGRIAMTDQDAEMVIWDSNTGEKLITLDVNGTRIVSVNNKIVGIHNKIDIYDFKTLFTLKGNQYSCLEVVDDNRIVTGSIEGSLEIWNLNTKVIEKSLSAHTDFVRTVNVLPNKQILSTSLNRVHKIWNYETNASRIIKGSENSDIQKVFHISNNRIVIGYYNGEIMIYNLETEKEDFRTSIGIRYIKILMDESIVGITSNKQLIIWNFNDGNTVKVCDLHDKYYCINQLFDGSIITGSSDGKIAIWK